jgi:hypothetical protein
LNLATARHALRVTLPLPVLQQTAPRRLKFNRARLDDRLRAKEGISRDSGSRPQPDQSRRTQRAELHRYVQTHELIEEK